MPDGKQAVTPPERADMSSHCGAANEPMTGRQKIEAALSPAGTPQVPAVICYEGIYVRDHWRQLTGHPWWYAQSPDIEEQLAWRRDVIERTGQDWFILPTILPREAREALRIEVEAGEVYRIDRRSGQHERLIEPRIGGWVPTARYSDDPPNPPTTTEQVDAAVPIPPEPSLEQICRDGRGDLARRMLDEFGERLWPLCHVSSPLWNCYRLWGFEGMMTRIADTPDLVRYACDRLLALVNQRIREAAAIGTAGVWIEECFTDLVSPEVFASINVPVMRRIVETIRAAGMKSIYYYCGDPASRWDLILSIGADAVSLEESKKNFTIDIEDVVERVQGRCAILGNLDAVGVLQDADETTLQAEIARQIAVGRCNANRFVMSLGSPVTPNTPVSRVRLYCDMVRRT
jgi:uroporphyrinogen-III decarboxylase